MVYSDLLADRSGRTAPLGCGNSMLWRALVHCVSAACSCMLLHRSKSSPLFFCALAFLQPRMRHAVRSVVPLLLLGAGRLLSTRGLNYQLHVRAPTVR